MVDKLVSSLQIDLGGCPRFIISTIITDRDLQMQHRAAALCTAHFIAWSAGVWCGGSLLIKYWPGVQCMSYHCWHV